jgi:hypothetical protein
VGGLSGPSARPPTCDKGREIGLGNPDGIHDAHVEQQPLLAQLVHGRGAHTESLRDLANRQQRPVGTSSRGLSRARTLTAFLKHGLVAIMAALGAVISPITYTLFQSFPPHLAAISVLGLAGPTAFTFVALMSTTLIVLDPEGGRIECRSLGRAWRTIPLSPCRVHAWLAEKVTTTDRGEAKIVSFVAIEHGTKVHEVLHTLSEREKRWVVEEVNGWMSAIESGERSLFQNDAAAEPSGEAVGVSGRSATLDTLDLPRDARSFPTLMTAPTTDSGCLSSAEDSGRMAFPSCSMNFTFHTGTS